MPDRLDCTILERHLARRRPGPQRAGHGGGGSSAHPTRHRSGIAVHATVRPYVARSRLYQGLSTRHPGKWRPVHARRDLVGHGTRDARPRESGGRSVRATQSNHSFEHARRPAALQGRALCHRCRHLFGRSARRTRWVDVVQRLGRLDVPDRSRMHPGVSPPGPQLAAPALRARKLPRLRDRLQVSLCPLQHFGRQSARCQPRHCARRARWPSAAARAGSNCVGGRRRHPQRASDPRRRLGCQRLERLRSFTVYAYHDAYGHPRHIPLSAIALGPGALKPSGVCTFAHRLLTPSPARSHSQADARQPWSALTNREMNMNPTSPTQTRSSLLAAASLTSVLLLAACASPPPPTASLKLAQQAIATAEQNEAGRYAPGELAESRTELAAANTAVSDKQMVTAKQLAEETTAAAEFASAKTADAKANAVNDEMKRSTATLIQEMQRSAGAQQ